MVAQNEGGGTYLDYNNPLQRQNFKKWLAVLLFQVATSKVKYLKLEKGLEVCKAQCLTSYSCNSF
jgi:hypothetical protein